jgi:hypothetical protein
VILLFLSFDSSRPMIISFVNSSKSTLPGFRDEETANRLAPAPDRSRIARPAVDAEISRRFSESPVVNISGIAGLGKSAAAAAPVPLATPSRTDERCHVRHHSRDPASLRTVAASIAVPASVVSIPPLGSPSGFRSNRLTSVTAEPHARNRTWSCPSATPCALCRAKPVSPAILL